jgi:hypothetical protein
LFFLALTPVNFRAGRMPFVFFASLSLIAVIGLLWLFTHDVSSQESRLIFIAFILLSLWLMHKGVSTERVIILGSAFATLHIGLGAYFGQGIFSPRVNWLYLIPILMFHIDGRRAGLWWGGVVLLVFLVAVFNVASWVYAHPTSPQLVHNVNASAAPQDPAEVERCQVPEFAKKIGHEQQWKLHNGCQ